MEDSAVLYVAGNPDAYPLEYYDSETGDFAGVIPELLRRFGEENGYEVVYWPTQGEDRRDHLAGNMQVDLVSGYREGDRLPLREAEITVFRTAVSGEEQTYRICLTSVAPSSLREELESFFSSVGQEEISGILMETHVRQPDVSPALAYAAGGLALTSAFLLAALILVIRRFRKRLRRAQENSESDEVTGLGNFDYLMRYYRQLVNDKNRILYCLYYFYVDTDRLRRLGDSREVDEFLRYCAVVLQEYAGESDVLAKVSEQGFVLLKLGANPQDSEERLKPLFDRIRSYAQTYAKPYEVHITAGAYPLRAEDRDLNEIIFYASQGAHDAERRGEDLVLCTDETRRRLAEERRLQSSLGQALEDREFALYLQFYVDAQTFRVMGGEALSRWKHPSRGLLTPSAFIPLFEREGLIYKLDYYCLEESCRCLQTLLEKGMERFFISCNFSRETFAAGDFVSRCKAIIEAYRFPRELLILELTESVSETHVTRIRENMAALKEFGVSIALDDFGVGFTSFADLQEYAVDGVKLDKDLIDRLSTERGVSILRAMIQLGHELGITVLAEGVETDEQVRVLQDIHCDVIQGFRFYQPIPAPEACELLVRTAAAPSSAARPGNVGFSPARPGNAQSLASRPTGV